MTETPNLSDEIHRRIRVGWMSFKRYTRELYDRPKASLLPLKARMVRSVVEALLNGCATWTPLKGHYTRRTPANRMREYRNNRAREQVVVIGGVAPHG